MGYCILRRAPVLRFRKLQMALVYIIAPRARFYDSSVIDLKKNVPFKKYDASSTLSYNLLLLKRTIKVLLDKEYKELEFSIFFICFEINGDTALLQDFFVN